MNDAKTHAEIVDTDIDRLYEEVLAPESSPRISESLTPRPPPSASRDNGETVNPALSPQASRDSSLHGWALARQAFLSKSKNDAVIEVWRAAAREAKAQAADGARAAAETTEALSELRKTRAEARRSSTTGAYILRARQALKRASTMDNLESPGSSRPGSPKQSEPLRQLFHRHARDISYEKGFFGSIRFPEAPRTQPSKFVRLDSGHNYDNPTDAEIYSKHVVSLFTTTWKLFPPCAMISVTDAGPHCPLGINTRIESILRRGIAEAAYQTSAWIFTNGSLADAGARTVGRAMVYLADEYGDGSRAPAIGVLPWLACAEHEALGSVANGYSRTYEGKHQIRDEKAKAELRKHGMQQTDLDPNHSHFMSAWM